ncbi:Lsr2 family protein [Terrabacter tumescens]|uniref:Lsr2 family protein n=1 Tax=Terrabacter tumescens TaxID=60443 RepID=A0ABQ2I3J7_9MICO|nr:Lsr2 family protein [Terrabacter tumescens]GGM99514.1 Lsr2 family protein [Terrabacter tumescens]
MATKLITTLVDDVDGTEAAETLTFALDGTTYEIDLSSKNAEALRVTVAAWAGKARQIGNRTGARRNIKAVGDSRNALIRAWAAKEGLEIPARGRIPKAVQRQYDAAQ